MQYSHLGDFEYAFGNDVTQKKGSESDAASQRDATSKGKNNHKEKTRAATR